ncbi:hypothetical protein BJ166DRAFT_511545 [Pestalotiopsis sp. NC0098]|nr:hypothetical protein BJ166DRAFT_511545 [Pestalotiopsis sp. NC0098]
MMRAPFSSPVCGLPRTMRTTLPRRYATASRSNGPAPGLAYQKKVQHQGDQQQWNLEAFEDPAYRPRPVPDTASNADLDRQSRHHAVAQAHKIKFPNFLRALKVPLNDPRNGHDGSKESKIWVLFSQSHIFSQQDIKTFDVPEHPGTGSVLDRYIEASDGSRPLWWSVNIYGGAAPPFVNTTAQRLLNRAIRLALEEKGYDRYGRRLVPHGVQPPKNNPFDIYGTLRIQCAGPKELCQLKFESQILDIGRMIIATALQKLDGSSGPTVKKRFDPRNKPSRPKQGSKKKTGYSQNW